MAWAPDYITLAQLKKYVRIPNADTADDDELADAITGASRAVDDHTNRQFGIVGAAEARSYTAYADLVTGEWVLPIDDLMSAVGLVVTNTDGDAVTEYSLSPANAAASGRPWTSLRVSGRESVTLDGTRAGTAVTALWGWTAVPVPVKLATKLQASRFHSRRDSPHGIAGSPDFGGELRYLAKLDPDVAVSLRRYVRRRRPA